MTPTTAAERLTDPATVKFGDQSIDLPVLRGTEGETAIDISVLRGKTGAIIGLVVGSGGAIAASKGDDVELPEGTVLTLRLERPLTLGR